MGIVVKIVGMEEEINLTEFTIKKYIRRMDSSNGSYGLMENYTNCIKLYGKVNLYDTTGEVFEMGKLSDWSKKRADNGDAYRHMKISMLDTNGEEYDSLECEKAFVVSYEENNGAGKGTIEFGIFIRDFKEEELLIKPLAAQPQANQNWETEAYKGFYGGIVGANAALSGAALTAVFGSEAHVWINGDKQKVAFCKDNEIYINYGVATRKLKEVATEELKLDKLTAKEADLCISRWKEGGIEYATYNPDMKDNAVQLIRKDSNVTITVYMYFYGSYANKKYINNTGNADNNTNKTYAELAYEGIKECWKSDWYPAKTTEDGSLKYDDFGDDKGVNVEFTFTRLIEENYMRQKHIRISIGNNDATAGQPITMDNIGWSISGGWLSARKLGLTFDIYLFRQMKPWFEEAAHEYYTFKQFSNCAAHEMGHSLGLGDCYDGPTQKAAPVTKEIPLYEVMRSNWDTITVESNTIEMILEAFKLNELQKYDPYNNPSKAIRLRL